MLGRTLGGLRAGYLEYLRARYLQGMHGGELGRLRSGLTGPHYRRGKIWMGYDSIFGTLGVGLKDDRHCITVAAARTGKGSCVITPNVYRWQDNLLLIDPKGENVEALRYRRDILGQDVHVLDPMHRAAWPERASFNPLSTLDPDRRTIAEDIGVIVNAIIMRGDPRAAYWDNGASDILAGLIAFLIVHQPQHASLPALKRLLNTAGTEGGAFDQALDVMRHDTRCAGLMMATASKLDTGGTDARNFLSTAENNTTWLNSVAMQETLIGNTFDLDDIRRKPCTICLVASTEYLDEMGRFLRLFVELSIRRMARYEKGHECLFLLDEFAALGPLKSIEKAAGLMPGYGVKLWPFVQDLGQLQRIYPDIWRSFFGNASLKMFFGCTEEDDLLYIQKLMGDTSQEATENIDLYPPPPLNHIREHIRKRDGDLVARRMLCFVPGREPGLSLAMRPYFKTREFDRVIAKAKRSAPPDPANEAAE